MFVSNLIMQGWLERLGIQNEGGVGYMLDKLITTSGELSLSVIWFVILCENLFFQSCVLKCICKNDIKTSRR